MFEKYIKELNPKPIFNLKWYKGEDKYSEGDIENFILELIAKNEPENYSKVIYENFNWSIYYHLTNIRKNILDWYPFKEGADLLEIGCGMGAITGMLCDQCASVTSVELSKKRAMATLLRCREKENLEIIVGNLNDISFEKKYDYITLIGVLEYQGNYTQTDNPYTDFLCKVKSLLKPEGKLLIAIENKYGLKYWCGAKEDHTGIPFDSINQYEFSGGKVRTFAKKELDLIVKESGFKYTYFYYPMPDYKLPTVIYSDNYLPVNENMLNMRTYYYPDNKSIVAQENKIYKDIIQNGVFDFFANSYLVECSDFENVDGVIFASLSNRRHKEYQMITRCMQNKKVEKYPIDLAYGSKHVSQIIKNQNDMADRGLHIWKSELDNGRLVSEMCLQKTAEDIILEYVEEKNYNAVINMFDKLYIEIRRSSSRANWEDNILYTFYPNIEKNEERYGHILSMGYLDMLLRNAFWINGEYYWFDQEWNLENVPAKYPMYRAILEIYNSYNYIDDIVRFEDIVKRYELVSIWEELQMIDQLFIEVVADQYHFATENKLNTVSREECINSIDRLLK